MNCLVFFLAFGSHEVETVYQPVSRRVGVEHNSHPPVFLVLTKDKAVRTMAARGGSDAEDREEREQGKVDSMLAVGVETSHAC